MTSDRTLVLVDGSGYIFRAFFQLPLGMTRPDGTPVNAVYGFSTMLLKLMREMAEDDMIVVFDYSGKSFRNDLYADYKANREAPPPELVPQFPLVRDAARAFGLPVIELEHFEADDIIATYTKMARDDGRPVVVVTSDKDLMQLVTDGVRIFDPMKDRWVDREQVVERFGVEPELVRDCLALAGDASDNVPGVPGIGVKTAAQLLLQFGGLDALLDQAHTIKQPKRRENLTDKADLARLSWELVGLRFDAPVDITLEQAARQPINGETLLVFLRENGFRSLIDRIEEVAAVAEQAQAAPAESAYETVTSLEQLDAIIADAIEIGRLAVDTETTSLNVVAAKLAGISLSVQPGRGWYAPVGHTDEFGQLVDGQLPLDSTLKRLRPVLTDPSVLKIGHNLKYDIAVLTKYEVPIRPLDDTMLISYVLDGASHGHSMDELAKRHLDHDAIPFESVCGKGAKQIRFDQAPLEKAAPYAAEDAEITLRLWQHLKPRLIEARKTAVYEVLERPLATILAGMEVAGITVDRHRLETLSSEFTQRMARLEEEAYKLAGRRFNVGSPKQLGEILFDELGLEGGKKTKTGAYATGAEILEQLAANGQPLPRTVLDWRQLQKLTRTYTDSLVHEIRPESGRVHTSYAMAATSTGRLSSTEPNLQNIPIRTEEGRKIREAFVPAEGHTLLSADYSQIELRVLAHVAGIDALKQAFAADIDIHKTTAAKMFKVPLDEVGSDLRRSAKTINYGIIYGIGAFGLAQRLGIAHGEAKAFIEAYFEQYPGVKDYMDAAKAEARQHGFVETLFGRRCYIPEINTKMPAKRAYAERQAINAPIQGSAADIMKRAMIHIDRAFKRQGAAGTMLLQVHDELVFEVPTDEVEATSKLVVREMEAAADMSVPLVVDIGSGATWGQAH